MGSDLLAMYAKAAELLAARDFDAFRWQQQLMADAMDDAGSPNAWVLRLKWETASKGPYPIFYVEVPEEAEGWLDGGRKMVPTDTEYTVHLRPAARRLLGRGSMLGRQPFAGFPAYGVRFLGSHCGCSYFWRFSFGSGRAEGMAQRVANRVKWAVKKKYAEDVYPGGYLNLFYPPGTVMGWRANLGEWCPTGRAPKLGDLFAEAR